MPIDVRLSVFGYPEWEAANDGNVYRNGELINGGKSDGYVMVYLGAYSNIDRAELVCTAWHGPKPANKHLVAHKNGHRTDDRPENLYWATYSENAIDGYRHGTRVAPGLGEKSWSAKLTESKVLEIRASSLGSRKLASIYGVSQLTINDVRARRSWRHI